MSSERNAMRYWYAHIGEILILGHGRTICQLVPQSLASQRLLDDANEYYVQYAKRRSSIVSADTFMAAMLAPLAVQELGVSEPAATIFSSASEVLQLFDGLNIEQVAINILNGRTTSAYAEHNIDDIAAHVARGFDNGDLWVLPRDSSRLHAPETLNTLPGVVVFLLSHAHAKRKAFSHYLRRGIPPIVSPDTVKAIAKSRPVLRTWEREARQIRERTCT
jgi:hypothetical protein